MRQRALTRSAAHVLLLAAPLLSLLLMPDIASSQNLGDPAPPNAHAKEYGAGWQCNFGYLQSNAQCVAIEAPADAHVVQSSFGRGWECDRGYREAGALCAKVAVPENAYL